MKIDFLVRIKIAENISIELNYNKFFYFKFLIPSKATNIKCLDSFSSSKEYKSFFLEVILSKLNSKLN